MNQPSYIFGGNTGLTYDQVQKQRDIANELLRANMSTPQNVGEGLSAIGRALAAKAIDKRTTRADEANRKASEARRGEAFASIFGGGGSAPYGGPVGTAAPVVGPTPITFTPETPNPAGLDPSIISAVDRVAPNQPQAMDANAVGSRLVSDLMRDLNLTQQQAAGVVGNLAHETGGFKHMQEISPLVPGSRGGYGFAQWTGPRRKAFEAWSAQNGLDPNSYEANYGFLQHELKNTPEGAVLGPLSQAQTAEEAAQVFSDKFLRPGIPAMGSRLALANQFAGEQSAPQAAPAGNMSMGNPDNIRVISELLADPYTPPGEKAMLEQAMAMQLQGMDPMRQMEMERTRLELDALKNPQPQERTRIVSGEEAATLGLDPSKSYNVTEGPNGLEASAIGGGGTTIVNDLTPNAPELGKLSQDYTYATNADGSLKRDENGLPVAVPVPGSPAAREAEAADAARTRREVAKSTEADVIITAAQRAREAAGNRDFGAFGSGIVGSIFPQSDSGEVIRQVNVLKANGTFSALQQMRENSPTGAALGAASDRDLQLLADKAGALDPSSPNIQRDLDDYERALLRTLYGPEEGDRVFEESRGGAAPKKAQPTAKVDDPEGFAKFAADPSAAAAAAKYGVTLEEMWAIKQGMQ